MVLSSEEALFNYYSVVYVDVDKKSLTNNRIAAVTEKYFRRATVEVIETKKGYHLKIYPAKKTVGFKVLLALLEYGCDGQYVRRWIERNGFALFDYRRGRNNTKHLYTLSLPEKAKKNI
jgi:hypothetical protein